MFVCEIISIIGILATLFYLSMIYTNPALLILTISSAGFVFVAFIFLFIIRKCISASIEAPVAVSDAGQSVRIRIHVINKNRIIIPKIQFSFFIRNCFEKGKVAVSFKASDVVCGKNIYDYEITLKDSGCYEVGLYRLQMYDFFGVVFCTKKLNSNVFIQMLPEITEIGVRLSEPVRSFMGDAEVFDDERIGQDTSETFGIRQYIPGDRLQRIHWKLTAKSDELMVKEMSLPKACPVVFFLEFNKGKQFDAFLQIVGSISFSLMDNECPHYLAWYDSASQDVVRQRVDSDESYYLFFCRYLKEQKYVNDISVKELYCDKYRSERYIYGISINEKLMVKREDEILLKASSETIKGDLGGFEIVL